MIGPLCGVGPSDTSARGRLSRSLRFDGYVGLEGYNSSIGDFAFERGMFHNVCPDGDDFVRRGIAFLREQARTAQS